MSTEIFRNFVKRHPSLFERLTEKLEFMWDAKVPNAPHHRAAINMEAFTGLANDLGFDVSIAPSPSESKKSRSGTLKLREKGNDAFVAQSYQKALEYYTRSIAFAPDRSEELALAFGNRSAVLYHLEKYELCILDVNRALKGRFPDGSKRKLIERRKNSLTKLEERNKIKSAFVEGKNVVLPNESFDERFNPIERRMCFINKMNIRDSDLTIDYSSFDDPIWNTKFDNALLPNVSSKVKFECNSEWGRHWVAKDNISAGEILAIEDFFALVMKRPMWYEHCSYCSVFCEALIPCPSCALQMYCSQACLQEAYNSYHRIECEVLPSVAFVDDYTLALRMFIVGTKQGSELTKLMKNPDVYLSLEGKRNCVGVHYPSDYLSILNLAWKIDNIDDDFLVVNLTYMINALRRANFFGGVKQSRKFTDVELFAALLLCHHSTIVRQYCGNLEIELIPSTDVILEKKHMGSGESSTVPISEMKLAGSAVSPFGNFLNHSCHANVVAISNKRRQLFYSIKPIEAGEQIFVSYLLLSYNSHPRISREDILPKQCYTLCKCLACVQNWPTLYESKNSKNDYLTDNQIIIKKIEKMQEWLKKQVAKTYESGSDLWKFNPDDLKRAFEFRNHIIKYVREPSPIISLCEKFIQKCMETKANIHLTLNTEEMMKYFNP